ncbi:MAG TPA: PDZ domain-containing protein [Gemmataceae bacterium]|nr:PDZ domain-containing protein [Gemmataceae bacterium]
MRIFWLGMALVILGLTAPANADEARKDDRACHVPYRMTGAQHIMVRAKINGKGPYNFIIDTGAPTLFVATALCQKLGIEPDKKGWGIFDRFEIEGGVVLTKLAGRIETPFQLEGMNNMGLAGVELHGVIGYTVLARYRITFDFTRDKMTWEPLDYNPPPPEGLFGKGGPPELNAMAGIMRLLTGLLGKRPQPEVAPRGFLGLGLADATDGVMVKSVIGPAAAAGIQPGDRLTEFDGEPVKSSADVHRLAARLTAGISVKLTITRGGSRQQFTIKAGEGL